MVFQDIKHSSYTGVQRYPAIQSQPSLPVATRMLLNSDGATTLLLQVLAGPGITAEVLPADAPFGECPELGSVFSHTETLSIRHSRLRDRTGKLISENLITYRRSDHDMLIPVDGTPFGLHTRRLGMFERRTIFRVGVTTAAYGALPSQSAARVYEICYSTGQRVLVHEIFSPRLVSTAAPAFKRRKLTRRGTVRLSRP